MLEFIMAGALAFALFSCSFPGGSSSGLNNGSGADDHTAEDQPISGPLTVAETWAGKDENDESITYYINSTYTIKDGGALTLESGAIVKFGPNGGIKVLDTGSLVANNVIFTSYRDSRGRKIIAAGESSPEAGDWKQIYIYGGTSKFTNCEFAYGGNGLHTLQVAKNTNKGKARVDNCLFKNNSGTAAVNYSIKAALFYDDAVDYDADKNCVTNTRFEGNVWPLSIPAFFSLKDTNTFVNNTYNYVHINYNHIKIATVWENVGVPYIYLYSSYPLNIDSAGSLTIVGGEDESKANKICISTHSMEINKGGKLILSDYVTFTNSPESSGTDFKGIYCDKDYKFDTNANGSYDLTVSKVLLVENPAKPNIKIENCAPTASYYIDTNTKYQYYIEKIQDENQWTCNYN